jgi:pimeloyl-ACP methyl ester carboxylesterase
VAPIPLDPGAAQPALNGPLPHLRPGGYARAVETPPAPLLLLLPGMGANDRLLAPQREVFPNLCVPPWLPAEPTESLAQYAARFAPGLEHYRADWIGGVSFGGFVALELAKHLRVRGVVLIASARSVAALRPSFRSLGPLAARAINPRLFPRGALKGALRVLLGPMGRAEADELTHQALAIDPAFLRWAVRAALGWPGVPALPCPVLHIHGSADRVLPRSRVRPDVTIAGAGHIVNMTHPGEVNSAITALIQGRQGPPIEHAAQ